MKIMWIANLPLPEMAERIGVNSSLGGWLPALSNHLKEREDVEFVYCFPQIRTKSMIQKRIGRVKFYGFYEDNEPSVCEAKLETELNKIYMQEQPDVVHLFGSEYYHAYAAVRSGIDLNKLVLSIQGIMWNFAKHYCDGISIKDRIFPCMNKTWRIGCIEADRKRFEMQGRYEGYVFQHIKLFEGRTDYDKAYVKLMNPSGKYFKCNRVLRKKFYEGQWRQETCEPYSVFLAQASYPVKGLHIFLEAMNMLRELIPEMKVYVGGQNICQGKDSSPYGNYIGRIIKRYHLENQINFLGSLCEEKMWEQFLKANVFVLPSVIENSPNSLAEAMILGVPCIAADVGGVSSMMEHAKEGYIYRVDEPHMLAYYLYRLMSDRQLAEAFSEHARKRALEDFDEEKNVQKVLGMYREIVGRNQKK